MKASFTNLSYPGGKNICKAKASKITTEQRRPDEGLSYLDSKQVSVGWGRT